MIKYDQCNRNGCKGTLYEREQEISDCSCHLGHPPCDYCVNQIGCCPVCGWNEIDSLGTRTMLTEKDCFRLRSK